MTNVALEKRCCRCKATKPLDEFCVNKTEEDGRSWRCRQCNSENYKQWKDRKPLEARRLMARRNQIKYNHGLQWDDVVAMLEAQHNLCAICKKEFSSGMAKTFRIDHCHSTGRVRALLCHSCNIVLGHVGDSIKILSDSIEYLKTHRRALV